MGESRGHVTFVATVHQTSGDAHTENTSYFVMLDCAGSEGESAFTPEFRARVTPQVLLCRRLEAGTINTGLSQLQVICNELRKKGKLSATVGNGLRRVLHPFIDTKTYLSVLFTLSPSVNNAKSTESTLKFAVAAGMVKVKPIATKGKVNFKTLAAELRAHIEKQEQVIDENNRSLENNMRMQNKIRYEIDQKKRGVSGGGSGGANDDDQKLPDGIVKKTRRIQAINDDGDEVSDEEEYFVDDSGKEVAPPQIVQIKGSGFEATVATPFDDETSDAVQQVLSGLDDTQAAFMKGLGNDFLGQMAEESMKTDKNIKGGRTRTVTMEENDEALRLAMEQYAKLTIPWQKEKLITQTEQRLAEIQEQIKKSNEEYNNIKKKQEAVAEKLADPNYEPEKDELADHAVTLSIMLAEQKAMTSALQQSKSIIIDFLKDDGREALVAFFKIKGGF